MVERADADDSEADFFQQSGSRQGTEFSGADEHLLTLEERSEFRQGITQLAFFLRDEPLGLFLPAKPGCHVPQPEAGILDADRHMVYQRRHTETCLKVGKEIIIMSRAGADGE